MSIEAPDVKSAGLFRRLTSRGTDALRAQIGLIITPVMAIILGVTMVWVWNTADVDQTTRNILEVSKLRTQFTAHLYMTWWSTFFVILIAVPAGIVAN